MTGLATLTFPRVCIGCSKIGELACSECNASLRPNPRQIYGENFKLFSALTYDVVTSKYILAAKEEGNRFAQDLVSQSITSAVAALLEVTKLEGPIAIVTIPSSKESIRRRGMDFLRPISQAVCDQLNQDRKIFQTNSVLRITKRVSDQTGLSEIQRSSNLAGAFRVTARDHQALPIILIDDVITTGSTLREAVRALQESNLTVLGAATACASERRLLIR